jgi:putative addiction module component (TIGR02574 family)
MTTVEELKPSLLALSEEERLTLADFLYESVEDREQDEHHFVSDREVMRRAAELEADPSIAISLEQLQAGFKDRFRR